MTTDTKVREREAGRGVPTRSRVFLAVLATMALAFLLASCGDVRADDSRSDSNGAGSGQESDYARVINVETLILDSGPFTERVRLTGSIKANRDVMVSAEESGVIVELPVEKGTVVQAGDPLVRIDDRILRSQVDQARAQAELADETWERRKRLWEEDRVGSELAYLEARSNAEQARANLVHLQERLERTVVRAPIGGILEDRPLEVGSMVSPGTPVARVVQVDPVKVEAGVPERFAADVNRGSPARITFDALRGEDFDGNVTYAGATVDPRNRTFQVELTLPNPGRTIKPEMVANVEIDRRTLEDVVVVPQEALVRVAEGFVAFVVSGSEGHETVERRDLVLGPAQRNSVVVEEGLEAGDRLVVVGQKQVAHGDRVRVVRTRDGGGDQ